MSTHRPLPAAPNQKAGKALLYSAVLAVAALAFFLRLRYLTLFKFHMDEFFTLTAANFIAESGLPRYPTGLFYDPGLPYSYITGILFWLLGFSEALGRWPAVIFGTLAVVTVYWLGSRTLRSPAVGLIAAFWLAISLDSVEWSGRARMISLAQWLGLFSVALLWLGLTFDKSRYRLWFALCYGLTLLAHFSTIVLMPAWFMSVVALWAAKIVRLRWPLVRDTLFLLLVFGLVVASGIVFQPPPSVEFQTSDSGLDTKVGELGGKFLQIPSDIGHAWDTYGDYFFAFPHTPLLLLTLIGLGFSLSRLIKGRPLRQDIGALYLGTIFLTSMAVLALVIAPHWQRARYLLMQVQGLFLILGAFGLQETLVWLTGAIRKRQLLSGPALSALTIGATIVLITFVSIPQLQPLTDLFDSGSGGWDRYDLALKHIRANRSEPDRIMTMHPPTSLLYLDQSDYYLVQSSPKLIVRPDGQIGDRYSGAIWLETAAAFNEVMTNSVDTWLVAQEFWLFNSYDGLLQQQILWQMDKRWGEGGVWALAKRPGAWPLASEPMTILNANFFDGARLLGFSTDQQPLTPGGPVRLTLFWQGNIPFGAKVFVQMRDQDNNTVAQADHFIYDGKVPTSRWPALMANDLAIRDGATLGLPADLNPGSYRVLVGFYHPDTFERLGVVDDQSGESAVILGEWTIR